MRIIPVSEHPWRYTVVFRVFSYIRFSDPEQANGDSTRRQRTLRQEFLDKNGYTLDESLCFTDPGLSAFRGKHAREGNFADFIQAVKKGLAPPGSILIVERLDRFSREKPLDALARLIELINLGIEVVTLIPERRLNRETCNDWALLEVIVALKLAHDESKYKAIRVRESWQGRRGEADKKNPTSVCPAWLRPKAPVGFEVIEEKAHWVRQIFKWAAEGYGVGKITKRLNRETGGQSICRRKRKHAGTKWHQSYVVKILTGRTVRGEYQPHEWQEREEWVNRNGTQEREVRLERVAVGEVKKDYYPAVVTEEQWIAAQAGLKERKRLTGPNTVRVQNLFTGLLVCARTGEPCRVADKGSRGKNDVRLITSLYSVPMRAFETWFATWFRTELNLADFIDGGANLEDEISQVTARLTVLTDQIAAKKPALIADPASTLWDVVAAWEVEKRELTAKLSDLQAQADINRTTANYEQLKTLLARLQDSPEEERVDLRLRVRSRIRRLIDRIWVLVHKVPYYEGYRLRWGRVGYVEVVFKSGKRMKRAFAGEEAKGDLTVHIDMLARVWSKVEFLPEMAIPQAVLESLENYRKPEYGFDTASLTGAYDRWAEDESTIENAYRLHLRMIRARKQGGKARVTLTGTGQSHVIDATGLTLRETLVKAGFDSDLHRVKGYQGLRLDTTPLDGQTFEVVRK
jgi:DNA invertase Pin-like site-specific DNA recombinase